MGTTPAPPRLASPSCSLPCARSLGYESYEIVESYPDDKYLPSYLVLARLGSDAIHVLFATDVDQDNVRVVTAYRPSPAEWEDDLKTRRVPS